MIALSTILSALPAIGPLMQTVPAVAALVEEVVASFGDKPADQETLREAIRDAQAENDEGHSRLQAKLSAAIAAGK